MIKNRRICALDVGTHKIAALCAKIDRWGIVQVEGFQKISTQGINAGQITDAGKLSAAIDEVMRQLCKMSGIRVRRVLVNFDCPDLKMHLQQGVLDSRQDWRAKKFYLRRMLNTYVCSTLPKQRKLVRVDFKQRAIIDAQTEEPVVDIVMLSSAASSFHAFVRCLARAHLAIEAVVPSGYAQIVSLLKRHRSASAKKNILIDFGAGLTKIIAYENGLVKNIVYISTGAQNITAGIKDALGVSLDVAERLKLAYGRLNVMRNINIQRIVVNDQAHYKTVETQALYAAIAAKIEELLEPTRRALQQSLTDGVNPVEEIIVTGGGALMEGFLERAEAVLGLPVKMGFLYGVNESRLQSQSALYATLVGLVRYGALLRDRKDKLLVRAGVGVVDDMISRASKLYYEYF
ncbi:MAG: cell division FtsA domain-containing protein [Candidatus Omnitrophota bacterium]